MRSFITSGSKLKTLIAAAAFAVVIIASVTTSLAWLTSNAAVANHFEVGKVSSEVTEKFDNSSKSDVRIKNTGTVDAYIRVRLIPKWTDAAGNTVALPTAGTYDYSYNTTDWTESADGSWYYKSKVSPDEPNNTTAVLIYSCTPKKTTDLPAEYNGLTFELTVLCSAIQADPPEAVKVWANDANNLTVVDGKLSVTEKQNQPSA